MGIITEFLNDCEARGLTSHTIETYRSNVDKKFTPHCFRHFFTTHLRRAGMKREFIQELRGDYRGDSIDIYDHIDPDELKAAYLKAVPQLMNGNGRNETLDKWC